MSPEEKLAAILKKRQEEAPVSAADTSQFPAIMKAKEFRESKIVRPPEIIKGVLTQGTRMILAGPSKSRKSWVLLDLCYSVASGKPWMNIPATASRTLYVNFELREHTIHDRINRISAARGIENDVLLDLWDLRGHACDIEMMVHEILRIIKERPKYGLICLDPTYKLLGARDENAAGEMTEFCSHLEWLAQESGAAVVAAAHFPKGIMGGRVSQDRIAGSGAFARDADAILTMTPHDKSTEHNPMFTVESTLREFAPLDPFVIRWEHPLMHVTIGEDPKQINGKPGVEQKYSNDELLKFVPGSDAEEGITKLEWRKKAADETGISKSTFHDRVRELIRFGAVVEDEITGKIKRGVAIKPHLLHAIKKANAKASVGGMPVNGNAKPTFTKIGKRHEA